MVATYQQFDGHYRPLSNHPACSTAGLYYDKADTSGAYRGDGNNDGLWTAASALGAQNMATGHVARDIARIPGYPCAALEYAQPNEDLTKPIVVLVHGNSTRPHTWEKYLLPPNTPTQSIEKVIIVADAVARDQLAEKLIAARYRVIAVDMRTDLVRPDIEPMANITTENAAANIDHGWSTPILQGLLKALMTNHPDRKIAMVGHSLGATVIRDALRRMWNDYSLGKSTLNPFPRISHVVLGSGAMHGVSTYETLCQTFANKTMRGTVACEMGSRSTLAPTYFNKPINGPRDLFATPCADGDFAFGKRGQCGGNAVKYYTVTMQDINRGTEYQDAYVSEKASHIDMEGCVTNTLTTLADFDTSGYFLKGSIANHFGSVRSTAGANLTMQYLAE
jgi:pimeloyl-ACP methyl ester carboxylesterase